MQKQFIKGYVTKTGNNQYRVLASTASVDRHGESIDQAGWQTNNYAKNPVMLWAHNYDMLPVAKATALATTVEGLTADFEFAPAEGNPMAQQIKVLYDEGFLNAVSVGLMVLERNGSVITKSELLEISFVPVPANQDALRRAVTKGLDVDFLEEAQKTYEEVEKGPVADELTAEQKMEAKYKNWSTVCDVLYAMANVYFDETVSVEAFNQLLSESIDILKGLVGTSVTNEGVAGKVAEKVTDEKTIKMREEFVKVFTEVKAGRTLSSSTVDKITKALEHNKNAATVLEQMITDSAQSGDGEKAAEGKVPESKPVEEEGIVLSLDDVAQLRKASQIGIRQGELVSQMLKDFLKNRVS